MVKTRSKRVTSNTNQQRVKICLSSVKEVEEQKKDQQQEVAQEQKRYNFRTRPGQAYSGNDKSEPPENAAENVRMKDPPAITGGALPDDDIVFLPPYTQFEIKNQKVTGAARRKTFKPRRYQWPAPVPEERYKYMRDPKDPFWKPINRRVPEYPLFSDLRQPFRTHPNGPYSDHKAFVPFVQRGRGRPRRN